MDAAPPRRPQLHHHRTNSARVSTRGDKEEYLRDDDLELRHHVAPIRMLLLAQSPGANAQTY
jgi:hypothetical protein